MKVTDSGYTLVQSPDGPIKIKMVEIAHDPKNFDPKEIKRAMEENTKVGKKRKGRHKRPWWSAGAWG
jgi:hypothetical protein